MNIQVDKMEVMELLVNVKSQSLVNRIKSILKKEMIVGYTTAGEPLTLKQYNARLAKAEEQIANGEVTSQEDFEKESEQW